MSDPKQSPPFALLRPERTLLVVVDLQQKLMPAISDREAIVRNSLLLMRLAEVLDVPVVLTTQYRRGLGDLLPEIAQAAPSASPLDKVSFGCFGDLSFVSHVRSFAGRDHLLVAGVEAHICVCQTVLGALASGFHVHVASDAIGSRTEANRDVGLSRMERAGALVSSTEMAVYELLGRSDGAAFKAMLPLLK